MFRADRDQDTICALSSAQGQGAIAIIRVSGAQALNFSRKSLAFLPEAPQSHRCYFGTFTKESGKTSVDEVLVTYFAHGHSFTGEEVLEISCHGSPAIVQMILRELISNGCRMAERGEFSYRAFMNGRLDLVQAEGILSLVQSQSEQSAKQALRQLKGRLSQDLREIEGDLFWCLAHIEASIDFSQENLEVVSSEQLNHRLSKIALKLDQLARSYDGGRIVNEGLRVAIVGVPNVGKSSLLNLLVGEEKAIVTDVPGTTRDLIEGAISIDGYRIVLVDTAGLRESQDYVEKIGIERTLLTQDEADVVLFVFDASRGVSTEEAQLIEKIRTKKIILVGNKKDLLSPREQKGFFGSLDSVNPPVLISTLNVDDRTLIIEELRKFILSSVHEEQSVVFQARHFESLSQALTRVSQSRASLKSGVGYEFIALELKEAAILVQEILGEKFDDQILDRIFREFCIGK